jgi:hypothetical protein
MADWWPTKREQMLEMADAWNMELAKPGVAASWGVPANYVQEFATKTLIARAALEIAVSSDRNSDTATARCKAAFMDLGVGARFIKNHFFRMPPMSQTDWLTMKLELVKERSAVPRPHLIPSQDLISEGVRLLRSRLALPRDGVIDKRSYHHFEYAWGLIGAAQPLDGQAGARASDPRLLQIMPARPEDCPVHDTTARRAHDFEFQVGDSGKTFCCFYRAMNEKGEGGPWSDIVTRIVP